MYFEFLCRSLLKAAIVVTPLLGFTWVIGILAINEDTTVFAWIFTILSSLQVLFDIFCPYYVVNVLFTGSLCVDSLCAEK